MGQEQSTNKEEEREPENYSGQANDNRSNQRNPNNDAFWKPRGYPKRPDDWEDRVDVRLPRGNDDNRSDQLNPNNPKYWSSRGLPKSSTSVVPLSSSKNEFQLDGDFINTALEIAGVAYGAYQIGNKLSQISNRMEANSRRRREPTSEEIAQNVIDGLEVAANVGLVAREGYKLYNKFCEEMEKDNEKHLAIRK